MKKLNSLKLSQIGKSEMEKREMINLRGGNEVLCQCEATCSCSDEPGSGSVYDSNWYSGVTTNGKSTAKNPV
jgi:natural product precursor